ncbi:MAG: hypothetical protein ACTSXU_07050 [Promethearchaeota archaeon]
MVSEITGKLDIAQYFSYVFVLPMFLLFFYYFRVIFRYIPSKLKIYLVLIIFFLFVFILGFLMTSDFVIRAFGIGLWSYLIGSVIQISGVVFISYFFIKIPSWQDIEWKNALNLLLVTYKGGSLLYSHSFKNGKEKSKEKDDLEPMMLASVLEVIKNLLNAMVDTELLKVLDLQDKKIIVRQGKHVLVAVIVDEELHAINILLDSFIKEFETFYADVLGEWKGDVEVFFPTKSLVKKIFA